MKIIDITGTVYTGMWGMGPPFPEFNLKKIKALDLVNCKVYIEEFKGMFSQTGTYLETPAHLLGYKKSYPVINLDIADLVDINTYVIKIDFKDLPVVDERPFITRDILKSNFNKKLFLEKNCRGILLSTGWGINWRNKNFFDSSPFVKFDAMSFIIEQKPFIFGIDIPKAENLKNPEGFFMDFFKENILLMAPCVNLEKIENEVVNLTVLPIKISGTCCTPCRAIVKDR